MSIMQVPQNKKIGHRFTLLGPVLTSWGEIISLDDWEWLIKNEYIPWKESLYQLKYPLLKPPIDGRDGTSKKEAAKQVLITDYIQFKNNLAFCIWHKEKRASLHYYPKTNSVFCFACGKYGDVIDVVQELHSCSFKDAIKILTCG